MRAIHTMADAFETAAIVSPRQRLHEDVVDPFRASPNGQRDGNTASISLAAVKADAELQALIRSANQNLGALGYTEHGFRHVGLVATIARNVLRSIGFDARQQELAAISGHLHDIGNVVNRHGHARTGALLAHSILQRFGANPDDTALVMGAIGSHEDDGPVGDAVHAVSAALILADTADVHRSRVRNPDPASFDRHDRVSFAATSSKLFVAPESEYDHPRSRNRHRAGSCNALLRGILTPHAYVTPRC